MAKKSRRPPVPGAAGETHSLHADGAMQRTGGPSIAEGIILLTAVLLLVVLGLGVQSILSPLVVTVALLYLMYPLRQSAVARRLMWLAVMLFAAWFLYSVLGLLTPFILAFLIAYILNPLVTRLEKHHTPRWASSLGIILLMIGLVVGGGLFIMPHAIGEFEGILTGVNSIVNDITALIKSGDVFKYLARFGVPVEKAQEAISRELTPRLEGVLRALFEGLLGFVSGLSSVVMQVINAVIIPFIAFYLLKDFPVILHRFLMLAPRRKRDRMVELGGKVDSLMGKYLRGAILVAAIQGTVSGLGLWIIGVPYALVLGIMTGILDFVPYVGLITSLVVSCVVALFSGGPLLAKVIAVIAMYLSQKLLEATVLGPKIVGSQVGLHPVLLILCLFVFGYFLGFVGLLIAVPATSLLIVGVKEWETIRRSRRTAVLDEG